MSAAIFMARDNGARACSVDLGKYRVLVEPRDSEDNAGAVELAERIEASEALDFAAEIEALHATLTAGFAEVSP